VTAPSTKSPTPLKQPTVDVEGLDETKLRSLISNYRRAGLTSDPLYLRALERLEEVSAKGLSFHKTRAAILKAARERRFISYKEIAAESGLKWSMALHRAVGPHMYAIIEYAHLQGWPLIGAIVVDQTGLTTGTHKAGSRDGFCRGARLPGYSVIDEEAFVREQQEKTFAWALSTTLVDG
jgi:hypothetical protein